jgi:hypothetical protein
LPAGGYCQDVQQKDEQIVRVPRFRRERFGVDEFEVDQPRSSGLLVVNDICRRRIAMRPRAVKFVAPELVCAPKFSSSRFQHSPRERAFGQMFPKIFPW